MPKAKQEVKIGDMDAGGVYVGKSATTGEDLHAALADEPEYLSLDDALAAADKASRQPGHKHAHVPTPEELDKNLYQNKDKGHLKGTFNTTGLQPGSCYRSSASSIYNGSLVQWFHDGRQSDDYRGMELSVRLVW